MPAPLLLSLLALSLLLALTALVATLLLSRRQKRLLNQYRVLLANGSPQDIETLLLSHATTVEQLSNRLEKLARQVASDEEKAERSLQRVGMLRYNAFRDTGSDQSFSVAILDGHGDGIVLTSLYGRTETRTYAKPLKAGKSSYPLSGEELAAINQAQGQVEG